MRKKSSKRNQATSLRSKSQRGSRGMEEAEVGKIRLYNPVLMNKRCNHDGGFIHTEHKEETGTAT